VLQTTNQVFNASLLSLLTPHVRWVLQAFSVHMSRCARHAASTLFFSAKRGAWLRLAVGAELAARSHRQLHNYQRPPMD
jgi:hypothetical protein